MSHHHRPTVQRCVGTLHRLREDANAEVMNGDTVNPLTAGAGLETYGGTGIIENPPNDQVRKDGPSRALSSLIPRVPGRRLYAMNAHTPEQLADPSSAGTYQYLLSHYGPLLTLKHLAEVLHSTPNGVRMTLARRREPLSVALSQSRRRLGRRVYFDTAGVAKAIAEAGRGTSGGRPPSSDGCSTIKQAYYSI